MARKRKGRLTLLEALKVIDEATTSRGYPDDGTGVAGDDDRPPGNIVYGEKYKRVPYFNRLTDFQERWGVDLSDWTWDEFENSQGMEDFENYSNTLQGMKDLFPDEVWRRVWAKMKNVPDDITTARFKKAGQPWRKGGEDQMSDLDSDSPYVDIDAKDDGAEFKDAKVKNEQTSNKIVEQINSLII
jgi:hypothetical protein